MFELETAVAEWRRQMAAEGIRTPAVLDELEGHLREDFEQRRRNGASADNAFAAAVQRLGEAGVLKGEFDHSASGAETLVERLKAVLFTLAGIPSGSVALNAGGIAPGSLIEPRWATYVKALFFCAPALLLWTFSAFFILPKVKHFSLMAGFEGFKLLSLMEWGTAHGVFFVLGLVALLGLLEWRSVRWPRYRRAALGTGAFALNSLVMVTITLMAISVLVTAVHARQ